MAKLKNKEQNIIPVSLIDISVDKETGIITMMNDGNGIDVEKHPEHDIYIPEMIFGHLMTSTNYKKNAKKITEEKMALDLNLCLYILRGVELKQWTTFAEKDIFKSLRII